jgi:hypothetical protein
LAGAAAQFALKFLGDTAKVPRLPGAVKTPFVERLHNCYQIFMADRKQAFGGSFSAAPFCNLTEEFASQDSRFLDMSSGAPRKGETSAFTLTVAGEITKRNHESLTSN